MRDNPNSYRNNDDLKIFDKMTNATTHIRNYELDESVHSIHNVGIRELLGLSEQIRELKQYLSSSKFATESWVSVKDIFDRLF
jgi:ribosomal protein S15P/S13E